MDQVVKNLPAMWETWVRSLAWEELLEEGMATYSSILAWRSLMDSGAWRCCSPWGHKELDMTEWLSTQTSYQRLDCLLFPHNPSLHLLMHCLLYQGNKRAKQSRSNMVSENSFFFCNYIFIFSILHNIYLKFEDLKYYLYKCEDLFL